MNSETPVLLLPARMVNQFVYCPRLFYLEWVRREWADSDDTAEGDLAHRAVSRRGGKMPLPDDTDPPNTTCEVTLTSAKLGLVAVVDRVDHEDGACSPVDYKKGKAPEGEVLWPGDEAQVFVHALLLEDAGYEVREVQVSYLGSRVRSSVVWDEAARLCAQRIVSDAWNVARSDAAPLPLVNSPKCVRCSLAALCLPDETNFLLERDVERPRRIVPRDADSQPLYVTEQGTRVGISGQNVTLTHNSQQVASVRLIDVSFLCLVGNVQASTQVIRAVLRSGGNVVWLSYGGWLSGFAQAQVPRNVELRRRQVLLGEQGRFGLASLMVRGKVANQRTLLMRNHRGEGKTKAAAFLKHSLRSVSDCVDLTQLMGVEGAAARRFFEEFPHLLHAVPEFAAGFAEVGRTRRPPKCPVNAVLSFVYSLLMKELVVACVAVGFDPYVGFLHQPRYGRPALALDLMEEFRPIVGDSVVLQLFNNGELSLADFVRGPDSVQLKSAARKRVVAAFERRMAHTITHPVFGYKISYRRVLEVQCRMLAAVLLGELPEYVPFTTR